MKNPNEIARATLAYRDFDAEPTDMVALAEAFLKLSEELKISRPLIALGHKKIEEQSTAIKEKDLEIERLKSELEKSKKL